jgi:hypothetical protein
MSSYTLSAYGDDLRDSYARFVRRNFGRRSYQSSPEYIEWLYLKNPYGRGYADFVLVLDESDAVVGCLHKMRFVFRDKRSGSMANCASIHNLMVDKNHRSGAGFLLIRETLGTEAQFVVPGVVGALSESYRKLGCRSFSSFWGYKLLRPSVVDSCRRVHGSPITRGYVEAQFASLKSVDVVLSLEYHEELQKLVNGDSSDMMLSEEYIRWRLFEPRQEVRTISLWSVDKKSCLLMCIGKRKGVPVGRVFCTIFGSRSDGQTLTSNALLLASRLGCPMVLVTSGDPMFADIAGVTNIKPYRVVPDTYYYSRSVAVEGAIGWPLVSDLGFEERFSRT